MQKRLMMICLLAAVGCGGGTTATDSGTPNDTGSTVDTGPATDSGPAVQPALEAYDGSTPATLDLSCLGTRTVPMGGADNMATVTLTEYLTHSPISGATLEVWTNDAPMGACAAPNCVSGMTDMMGHVALSAPAGGRIAYHITGMGTAEVLAYNFTWPAAGTSTTSTAGFASSTISTISTLLGRTFNAAAAGAASGQVVDCMGHTVKNAEVRVFNGTTQIMNGPASDRMSPIVVGLEGTSPTTRQGGYSGSGGTFVGANVPPGDSYHVEIWGVRTAGSAAELIGCEEGRVVAGGITVLTVAPLRSDYAAGSACAMAAMAAGH